jgi:hydroxyethylthiazole kinase-like sugar kinase family protein
MSWFNSIVNVRHYIAIGVSLNVTLRSYQFVLMIVAQDVNQNTSKPTVDPVGAGVSHKLVDNYVWHLVWIYD